MAAPPSLVDAVQLIVDWVDSNEMAPTPVGAFGTVDGIAVFDAADEEPVPALFVVVTVNVYELPLERPVIVQVVVAVVHVAPPGLAVTV